MAKKSVSDKQVNPRAVLNLGQFDILRTYESMWADSSLPDSVKNILARSERITAACTAVSELLAIDADHRDTAADNSNVEYTPLCNRHTSGLTFAQDELLLQLARSLEEIRNRTACA